MELKITHACQIELKTTQVKIHKAHGSTAETKYYLKSVCNDRGIIHTSIGKQNVFHLLEECRMKAALGIDV